ncbi:hypothetical protein C8Q70DRAFT_1052636 [Cubamyces menziesii]|nr:hypothetical protein C8Q70DRAFT_1052636 [Cubamyces menziesii]
MATAVYVHSLDQASGAAAPNTSQAFFAVASPPASPLKVGLCVELFLLSSLAGHPRPAPDAPLTIVTPVYFTGKIVAERMEHSDGREYLAYNDDRAAPIQRAFIRAVPRRGEAVSTDVAAALSARLAELAHGNPRRLAPACTLERHPPAQATDFTLFRTDDDAMGEANRGPIRLPVPWKVQTPGLGYAIFASPIQPRLAGFSTHTSTHTSTNTALATALWRAHERAAPTPPLPVPRIRR